MSQPKLHHYVPQFYLKYFCNKSERVWVWDKKTRKVFQSKPKNVAAATHFYRVPELIGTEADPLFLEKELSSVEGEAASILSRCIDLLDTMQPLECLKMTAEMRSALSYFIAMQILRTSDHRDILELTALVGKDYKDGISEEEKVNLHAHLLSNTQAVDTIAEIIFDSIWMYAKNTTNTPFWTSDNPVAFKTGDNRMWLKMGFSTEGGYFVFPLTPSYVLYCKEPKYWSALRDVDSCLSPVELTEEMVQHENAGQVFMATRHVISPIQEFSWADEFVESVGTNMYALDDEPKLFSD